MSQARNLRLPRHVEAVPAEVQQRDGPGGESKNIHASLIDPPALDGVISATGRE
jgi:hypothetical protein